MKSLFLNYIFMFLLLGLLLSCDNSAENEQEDENEYLSGQRHNTNTNFDELDKKMREVMNDNIDEDGVAQDVRVIEAKGAKRVNVDIEMGAGKLRLGGGSSELLIAGFLYSKENWKPEINYIVQDESGNLNIKQPKSEDLNISDNDKYIWNLKFNSQIPLGFNIDLGAGETEVNIGNLNIEDFSMTMGIGKTEIDLRGVWAKSTTIHLSGGIGFTRIFIPQNIGVILNVDKGIGDVEFSGLIQKSRNLYVNKLYENSDIVLTINMKSGIGKIEVE